MHAYSSSFKNMLDPLGLFAPKPKAPDVAAAPSVPTAADAATTARNASLEAQASGGGSTILTSAMGDTSTASLDKKKLLG